MGQTGFQIGSYSVLSRLGAGGMGEVWLATRGGKQCVVKTLLPHLAEDSRVREMFIKEGRVASMISDPSVVRIYELGSAGGQYFMALEYVDGTSLDRLVAARRALPPEVAAYVAARAAAGLQAIHEQRHPDTGEPLKIVHRDISPSNLLLSLDGEVKVADFGIAKTFTTDPGGTTTVGSAKGKIAYMSPEQARGKLVDQRTDLFALGIVLYELLAGDIPYVRIKNDYEMLAQVVYGRGRPLKLAAPAVPAPLAAICERAMAIDPDKRWPTARAMRTALEEWLAGAGGPEAARATLHDLVASWREQQPRSAEGKQETKDVELLDVSPSMIMPIVTPKTVNVRSPTEPMPEVTPKQTPVSQEPLPAPAAATAPLSGRRVPWTAAVAAGLGIAAVVLVVWGVTGARPRQVPAPELQLPVPSAMTVKTAPAAAEPQVEPAPVPPAAVEPEPNVEAVEAEQPATRRTPQRAKVKKTAPKQIEEPGVPLETVPPVDVYAGSTFLGRTPVEVPAQVTSVRLVSAADGIDYTVKLSGQPQKIVVPRASLHVRVDPWAEVTLDGRALGVTPLPPSQVYAGRHVIDLVNDDLKVKRRVEVELSGGEQKVVREKL